MCVNSLYKNNLLTKCKVNHSSSMCLPVTQDVVAVDGNIHKLRTVIIESATHLLLIKVSSFILLIKNGISKWYSFN
jgi:hypothetical protein